MKPIVRVVFDFDESIFEQKKFAYEESDFYPEVERYKTAVETLAQEAFVMGEIVDSSAIYRCHFQLPDTRAYSERTKAYVRLLGRWVDLWEIGNEINGEWAGWLEGAWQDPQVTVELMQQVRARVASEIKASFDAVVAVQSDAKTALTFYYNDDGKHHGWTDERKRNAKGDLEQFGHNYGMLKWAEAHKKSLPKVDYVFLSYYEDDNEGVLPNRHNMDIGPLIKILEELAKYFDKNTRFGFGEFGPQCPECIDRKCRGCLRGQAEFINRYYVDLDSRIRTALKDRQDWNRRYVGGYFYWYFKQDVINQKNPKTIQAFQDAFSSWKGRPIE